MRKTLFFIILAVFYSHLTAQDIKKNEKLLKELSENGCKCIDSINTYNKSRKEVTLQMSACMDKQVGAFQLGSKLMGIKDLKDKSEELNGKKEINLSFNVNKDSEEYKQYYYQLERYMMGHCKSLKDKIAKIDIQSENSFSNNEKALAFYSQGLDEAKEKNYKNAIDYLQKAVAEDPKFAFAWDNLGINYRRLNNFDKAIECYKKSLEIEPTGLMPLQNIAVVYQYKKEYQKAIDAYKKIAEIDHKNPEIYYGIGNIYTHNLVDYEKGLDYMCKAYNIYIELKSPYRTDAEKLINLIHSEMKKQGKEEKFKQILKENHISSN